MQSGTTRRLPHTCDMLITCPEHHFLAFLHQRSQRRARTRRQSTRRRTPLRSRRRRAPSRPRTPPDSRRAALPRRRASRALHTFPRSSTSPRRPWGRKRHFLGISRRSTACRPLPRRPRPRRAQNRTARTTLPQRTGFGAFSHLPRSPMRKRPQMPCAHTPSHTHLPPEQTRPPDS